MAVIEVNVSTLRVQPVARRYRTHPLQKVIHSTSHSPPGLQKTQFPAGKPRCAWSFVALWFASGLFSVGTATITVAERRVKPAMRFPVYESLYFLNRNLHDILVILEEMKRSPGMPQRSFEAYQVEIQYLRSHDTQDVLEVMNDTEIHEMAKLGKQRKAYDDSMRDLDDVYFEVQRREEQRRKQGLLSLIGVLPLNYQPPVSETGELDDEIVTSDASQSVRAQNRIKSSTRSPHGKSSARRRPRRRPERAS